jgi:hypothetical protein
MPVDPELQRLIDGPLISANVKGKPIKGTMPRGYYAPPGTGPEGETCRTCKHLYRREMGKTYFKCHLERHRWTGGGATDIRTTSPACRGWEKAE